jgi:hypothetical protein
VSLLISDSLPFLPLTLHATSRTELCIDLNFPDLKIRHLGALATPLADPFSPKKYLLAIVRVSFLRLCPCLAHFALVLIPSQHL